MATALAHRWNTSLAALPKAVALRGGDRPRRLPPEVRSGAQHNFPIAPTIPLLPAMPDEILDFYGFVFCQGGFRHTGMSFEQFLMAVAATRDSRSSWRCDDFNWAS